MKGVLTTFFAHERNEPCPLLPRAVPRGDDEDDWQVIDDPTEGALIGLAAKAGVDPSRGGKRVLCEIPFDSPSHVGRCSGFRWQDTLSDGCVRRYPWQGRVGAARRRNAFPLPMNGTRQSCG